MSFDQKRAASISSVAADVVGMGVDPVRSEEPARPRLPEHAGQLRPGVERRLQTAVGQAQVLAPVEAENFRGGRGFLRADFRRAERRRLAGGQIEHADVQSFGLEFQNRPRRAQFGVVGMRSND